MPINAGVVVAQVAKLNDVFKSDLGRRCFTQVLKKTMKDTQSLIVSEPSFELLLFAFNTVLQVCAVVPLLPLASCAIFSLYLLEFFLTY